jgi:hypothetical protein
MLLIASQALIGCGSGMSPAATTNTTSPSPAALTGNWNLLGNRALQQYPLLSLTLVVNGNQITATGDGLVECTNSGGGGTLGLSGQIATDGTFELNESPGNQSSFLWAITGTAPPPGGSTWTGTYTLTSSPAYTGCTIKQSGPFTATTLPPFSGTYTGTLLEGLTSSPTGSVTISVDVAQGAAVMLPPVQSYLPLSGTITVSGSPCFTHGTSSTTPGAAVVKGDTVAIAFNMDDGSQAVVNGFFPSPDQSALSLALFATLSGQCSGTVYGGTLTRQ